MAETARGIPLIGDTTIVNPISVPLNAIANALDGALDDALDGIPQNYRIGLNAERLAPVGWAPREGLRFYTTDTNVDWLYTESIWIPNDRDWTVLAPLAGWTPASSGAIRYRRRDGMLEVLPVELARSGGGITVTTGANINVATLPTGYRPSSIRALGTGTIGVGGNLGASRWFVDTAGNIFFQSLVVPGTMAVGASVSNHVQFGGGMFELS